jgi:ferric-dicitrate binding protein FerR (iron transport regulator)
VEAELKATLAGWQNAQAENEAAIAEVAAAQEKVSAARAELSAARELGIHPKIVQERMGPKRKPAPPSKSLVGAGFDTCARGDLNPHALAGTGT